MTVTQNRIVTNGPQIINMITDSGSLSDHRHHLSEMFIARQQQHVIDADEHKNEVYHTFFILNQALKDMERGSE